MRGNLTILTVLTLLAASGTAAARSIAGPAEASFDDPLAPLEAALAETDFADDVLEGVVAAMLEAAGGEDDPNIALGLGCAAGVSYLRSTGAPNALVTEFSNLCRQFMTAGVTTCTGLPAVMSAARVPWRKQLLVLAFCWAVL